MPKKEKKVKCPICDKEINMPDELKSWDKDIVDEKTMEEILKKVQKNIDSIIEFLNHDELTNNVTKRMAILTWVLRRIIQNVFTSNYHRLGILQHLIYEIHRIVELHEISKTMKKKTLIKQQKSDLVYVS